MQRADGSISSIVGADRIARNGDTANKIGTYALAILAAHHGIPFYVAAPRSTFDFTLASGAAIPIEERAADEVAAFAGRESRPRGAPSTIRPSTLRRRISLPRSSPSTGSCGRRTPSRFPIVELRHVHRV